MLLLYCEIPVTEAGREVVFSCQEDSGFSCTNKFV